MGAAESSTVGNFAVQMAVLEGSRDAVTGAYAEQVSRWAGLFVAALERVHGEVVWLRDRLPLHVYHSFRSGCCGLCGDGSRGFRS